MPYKSHCKACDHKHEGSHCNATITERGTVKLKPYSSYLWNDECGQTTQEFEFEQTFDCRCRFYIPSDNLEYLEWKYNESTSK